MRRILNTVLMFVITLAVSFASSSSFAGEPKGGGFLKKMTKELELTAEQQETLKKMHDGNKAEIKQKRKAMKAAHEELEKALQSDQSNDEVRNKFNSLQKQQDEFAKARFEKILSVRAILTPEQRKKMRAMPHHERHSNKWNKRDKGEE